MAASLVHFGVDNACRIPVLQIAGFQVDLCSSIDSLIEILERERVDAVVSPPRPELKVDSVVSAIHSRASTSVILFVEGPGQPSGTEADLVIPVLTPPWEWLANIAEFIAQSKALRAGSESLRAESQSLRTESESVRAESESLRAEASRLRSESIAARQRIAKQVELAEEIGKHFPRNKPNEQTG